MEVLKIKFIVNRKNMQELKLEKSLEVKVMKDRIQRIRKIELTIYKWKIRGLQGLKLGKKFEAKVI